MVLSPCIFPVLPMVLSVGIDGPNGRPYGILMGRQIMEQVSGLKPSTSLVRKILRVIILASVIFAAWPERAWSWSVPIPAPQTNIALPEPGIRKGLPSPYPAPQIAGIESWINSAPLSLDQLKGKVVLVHFWTYACINCQRTLPFVTRWDETYRDKGLVIIGVHTPEFGVERNLNNVQRAIKKYNIHYAVALDNNFETWRHFQNQYWPAQYLIDRNGNVVYVHFGEGNYEVTESNIRFLLGIVPNKE